MKTCLFSCTLKDINIKFSYEFSKLYTLHMLRNIFGVILVVWVFVNSLLIIFIDTWEAIDKLILILLNLGILLTIYVYIFKNSKDNKRKLLLYFALFQLLMFFIE